MPCRMPVLPRVQVVLNTDAHRDEKKKSRICRLSVDEKKKLKLQQKKDAKKKNRAHKKQKRLGKENRYSIAQVGVYGMCVD